jgi:peptidoglycan/LPS O-acetylase OafA/YrhL
MNNAVRLQELDGFCGMAILLVVIYHLWIVLSGQGVLSSGSPWAFMSAGNKDVSLFLVLSGFFLSLPFIKAFEPGQFPSIWIYVFYRALRILQPYYFVGLIGIVLTGQFHQLVLMFFFTAAGYEVGYFSIAWWNLSTEVQLYLFLLIVVIAVHNRLRVPLLALLGVLKITTPLCYRLVEWSSLVVKNTLSQPYYRQEYKV